MPKFICLQAGHEGRISGATGAPGEIELNVRIRNRLSQILIEKGFVVQLVNADPIKAEYYKDFDLFLALHGDADIYGTGGGVVACIAPPPYDSSEESNAKSRAIRDAIISEYFNHSGIVNHPERSNKKMTKYYMWPKLTDNTSCVIIEMGVVQDAHDKVLLADTERISTAIARGICKAFNVDYETTSPVIENPPVSNTELEDLKRELIQLKLEKEQAEMNFKTRLADKDIECQEKITTYKEKIINYIKSL